MHQDFYSIKFLSCNLLSGLAGLLLLATAPAAMAQVQQTLEMQTGQGGPAGNGPSVANQVVTMQRNTSNPAGTNIFVPRAPAVTVTYSLTNQQYTGLTVAQGFPAGTGGNGVFFGGTVGLGTTTADAFALYPAQNGIGAPTNAMFTSAGNSPAGTRIDVAQNAGISVFSSAHALYVQAAPPATNARVRMADLTLTFSAPVNDPVVHLTGMGGFVGTVQGFSTEFDLVTPGLTLTRLSGNPPFIVSANAVNNGVSPFSNVSTSCAANVAACGSVRVNGTGITNVTLRIFLRGDGDGTQWNEPPTHAGDVFLVSASLNPFADLAITKTNTPAAGPNDQANDTLISGTTTTYSLVATNNGVEPVDGAVVRDTPGAGLTCPAANIVTVGGTGPAPAGGPFTVASLTGTGITLGVLTAGQTNTFSFQCTVN